MKTIKDLYQKSKQTQVPLLSNYSGTFWATYVSNYNSFDNVFNSLFKSFIYFDQEEDEDIDTVLSHFRTQINNWLLLNDKRYSEMYRINVVPDNADYSITENYSLHETYSGTNSNQGAVTSGQRTDLTTANTGSQQMDAVNKVTGYNSATENTANSSQSITGTRQDTSQLTKGKETDTSQSSGTDSHTLTRHGAIGTQTADQVMDIHNKFWISYNFYMFIFNEIRDRFLLVGGNEWQ